jgi:hypothetical protein
MFRRVHANSANLFHGRSPLFEICNDLILAQSMPSGAVHPNTHAGFRGSTYTPAALAGGSRPFPVHMTQATLAIRETSSYHPA